MRARKLVGAYRAALTCPVKLDAEPSRGTQVTPVWPSHRPRLTPPSRRSRVGAAASRSWFSRHPASLRSRFGRGTAPLGLPQVVRQPGTLIEAVEVTGPHADTSREPCWISDQHPR